MEPTRVLFVCLGNICRSPLAESVFRHLARERGVEDAFEIDSAGTSGYHIGAAPDRRSVETARARGIEVAGSARRIEAHDLNAFDYVIVMDGSNRADVEALAGPGDVRARIHRLREWDPDPDDGDVPDPYYGGARGFDDVHDVVERSCSALLERLVAARTAGRAS